MSLILAIELRVKAARPVLFKACEETDSEEIGGMAAEPCQFFVVWDVTPDGEVNGFGYEVFERETIA